MREIDWGSVDLIASIIFFRYLLRTTLHTRLLSMLSCALLYLHFITHSLEKKNQLGHSLVFTICVCEILCC
jgi:hypothetical protein